MSRRTSAQILIDIVAADAYRKSREDGASAQMAFLQAFSDADRHPAHANSYQAATAARAAYGDPENPAPPQQSPAARALIADAAAAIEVFSEDELEAYAEKTTPPEDPNGKSQDVPVSPEERPPENGNSSPAREEKDRKPQQ